MADVKSRVLRRRRNPMSFISPLVPVLALMLALVSVARAEPDRPAPSRLPGPPVALLAVKEGAITVKTAGSNRTGSKELTLTVDAKRTRVTVGEIVDQTEGPDGRVHMTVKSRPGSLADLKVGQRLRVVADGDAATSIEIVPAPEAGRGAGKDGKSGGKRK
jgi:hypothetical protein